MPIRAARDSTVSHSCFRRQDGNSIDGRDCDDGQHGSDDNRRDGHDCADDKSDSDDDEHDCGNDRDCDGGDHGKLDERAEPEHERSKRSSRFGHGGENFGELATRGQLEHAKRVIADQLERCSGLKNGKRADDHAGANVAYRIAGIKCQPKRTCCWCCDESSAAAVLSDRAGTDNRASESEMRALSSATVVRRIRMYDVDATKLAFPWSAFGEETRLITGDSSARTRSSSMQLILTAEPTEQGVTQRWGRVHGRVRDLPIDDRKCLSTGGITGGGRTSADRTRTRVRGRRGCRLIVVTAGTTALEMFVLVQCHKIGHLEEETDAWLPRVFSRRVIEPADKVLARR